MTVSSTIPVNTFCGNNSATQFDFDFLIENEDELKVTYINKYGSSIELKNGIDYSINKTGSKNGSYITFPLETSEYKVLSEDEKIILELTLPIKQESKFENSGSMAWEAVEWSFDYIVRILQILDRKIRKSVKIPEGSNYEETEKGIIQLLNEIKAKSEQFSEHSEQQAKEAEKSALEAVKNSDYVKTYLDKITEALNIIKPAEENSLGMIKPDNKTTYVKEGGILSSPKWNLFDLITKDHKLTFEESEGLELLGEYVYKEAQDGRYGYPDFYDKCIEEYHKSTEEKIYKDIPLPIFSSMAQNGIIISDVNNNTEVLKSIFNGTQASNVIGSDWTKYWINIDYGKKVRLKSYLITADSDSAPEYPREWELWGYNGVLSKAPQPDIDYTVLDTKIGQVFSLGQEQIFEINTNEEFQNYRLVFKNGLLAQGSGQLKQISFNAEEWTYSIFKYSNGHQFYEIKDKDKIDEIYEKTGVAWYYGIDEENERILLPKNKYFFQNAEISEIGNSVKAGLPNIEGTLGGRLYVNAQVQPTGAFKLGEKYSQSQENGTTTGFQVPLIMFDASLSSPIYGSSTTVQPPAVKTLIYMVVGNTTITKAQTEVTEVAASENDTVPLFTGMYFDFKPNHVSWIKAGTEASGEIYESAYNELVKILKGEETKYGDGFKVVKENEKLSDRDYSEYWIINEETQTFKTPLKTTILNTISSARILVDKKEPTDEDPSWYNLYSDGWLEQGGINPKGVTYAVIQLPLSYRDTNYNILISQAYQTTDTAGTTSADAIRNYPVAITPNQFEITIDTNYYCFWKTQGYATPQTAQEIANSENIGLYFKVANAVENIELIDAGQILEDCVLKSQLTPAQCVIDTYTNGASGYRIWTDGYCEQWGRLTTNSDNVYTVNLLKEMEDTNYLCLNSRGVTGNYRASIYGAHDSEPFNFTTTSFDVYGYPADGLNTIQWKVTGYLKEGEY